MDHMIPLYKLFLYLNRILLLKSDNSIYLINGSFHALVSQVQVTGKYMCSSLNRGSIQTLWHFCLINIYSVHSKLTFSSKWPFSLFSNVDTGKVVITAKWKDQATVVNYLPKLKILFISWKGLGIVVERINLHTLIEYF